MNNDFFIVAVDKNWGIAKDHKIPWHYPEDFKFFKDKTKHSKCVMGYNTFSEIASIRKYPYKVGELLPGRQCYVVTSKDIPTNNNVISVTSLETLNVYNDVKTYIGGQSIYEYAIKNPKVSYGYITMIDEDYGCDLFFNKELLNKYFEYNYTIETIGNLRFQKWIRKTYEII